VQRHALPPGVSRPTGERVGVPPPSAAARHAAAEAPGAAPGGAGDGAVPALTAKEAAKQAREARDEVILREYREQAAQGSDTLTAHLVSPLNLEP